MYWIVIRLRRSQNFRADRTKIDQLLLLTYDFSTGTEKSIELLLVRYVLDALSDYCVCDFGFEKKNSFVRFEMQQQNRILSNKLATIVQRYKCITIAACIWYWALVAGRFSLLNDLKRSVKRLNDIYVSCLCTWLCVYISHSISTCHLLSLFRTSKTIAYFRFVLIFFFAIGHPK